jgi:SOS response regulatory protein OraA/RecX
MFKRKNPAQELASYIKRNLRKGYTKESLKWALLNQGYSKIEVERAFYKADTELAAQAPILKAKPEIEYKVLQPTEEPKKSFWRRWF